jgi:hypothetical protein
MYVMAENRRPKAASLEPGDHDGMVLAPDLSFSQNIYNRFNASTLVVPPASDGFRR